jgi:hypothetical protein
MHPAVKQKLQHYFWEGNLRLCALLGRSFAWADALDVEGGSLSPSVHQPASPASKQEGAPMALGGTKGGYDISASTTMPASPPAVS